MNSSNFHSQAFMEEAEELLAEIEDAVLEIEQDPKDKEAVDRLFRAMHTIKGSGGMFGFDDIADFTHHVENILDEVREGRVPVTKDLIDLVLASRDQINAMLNSAKQGIEVDKKEGDRIISALNALRPKSRSQPQDEPEDSQSLEVSPHPSEKTDTTEMTYRIRFCPDSHIFISGADPKDLLEELSVMGESILTIHTKDVPLLDEINAEQCYIFWDIVLTTTEHINTIRDVFMFVEDTSIVEIHVIDQEEKYQEFPENKKIGEILVERSAVSQEKLNEVLSTQKRIGDMLVQAEAVDRETLESALAEQFQVKKVRENRAKILAASSIRVAADKLDTLVDLVGELVTAQARLSQKAATEKDSELIAIAEELERLTGGLRDNTMSVRMLPIGTTFTSFKRLVRDLAGELGKNVGLVTIGGETELDKTVIERLKDPMVHIIRNCIDHGIEDPEIRGRSGKPEQGMVGLSAEHCGAHVVIDISDDGRGLDSAAIRQKAIEKGMLLPDAEISEKEAFHLICTPGFSTAEKVTDVSGRGVGMDVVKRNIEALRGVIDISSEKGVGTTISLKLPLTLAIIDGLMVTIGKDYFILPLSSVEECVELKQKDVEKVKGRSILNVRGEAVPYIRLREKFDINSQTPPLEQIVITEVNGERVGFVVDDVIGGHQTVIKSLGPAFKQVEDISGATILGDGTVALILDVNKLYLR